MDIIIQVQIYPPPFEKTRVSAILLDLTSLSEPATAGKLFRDKLFKVVAHQYSFIIFFRSDQDFETALFIESLCCLDCIYGNVSASCFIVMDKPFLQHGHDLRSPILALIFSGDCQTAHFDRRMRTASFDVR